MMALGGWLGMASGSCYVMPMILAYGLLTYVIWLFELLRLRLRKIWLHAGKTSFLRGVLYWVAPALWLIIGQTIEMTLSLDNLAHETPRGCWSQGKMTWIFVYVPIASLCVGVIACLRLLARVHSTSWVRPALYTAWFIGCWSMVPIMHKVEAVQWVFATCKMAYAVTYLTGIKWPRAAVNSGKPLADPPKVDMEWDENLYY
jgi:hypothetical protein